MILRNNHIKHRKAITRFTVIIIALCAIIGCSSDPISHTTMERETFERLTSIRTKKKSQLLEYLNDIHELARSVQSDRIICGLFARLKNHYGSGKNLTDLAALAEMENQVELRYVSRYQDFYNMLFIDETGYVFHAVKDESIYHTNIFNQTTPPALLARQIKENPERDFIDFEYFLPSSEPASFFVIALKDKGRTTGWIVLQCAINNINLILSDHADLGKTGEIYLVNSKKLMLTDSRFIEDSTILKRKIDTKAVNDARSQKSGNRIIQDYRGIRVYSSFEEFECFGSRWMLLAEIDENEVITDYFLRHKKYFLKKIYQTIAEGQNRTSAPIPHAPVQKKIRIDMNEFKMAKAGETLETKGIATCTAFLVWYPKKFGYLVHISPADKTYGYNWLASLLLNDKKTTLISDIIKRMRYFDIVPNDLKNLRCVIIANHTESFSTIIDRLVSNDIQLSQIIFCYNPRADYANIEYRQADDAIGIEWHGRARNNREYEVPNNAENLAAIVKRIIAP